MAERVRLNRSILSSRYTPSAATEVGILEQEAVGQSQITKLLNTMSGFFYDQMAEKVVEEGQMYGATNPITMEELEKASLTGEDPTKRLGYGTKGKAARSTAFQSVMSEIELQATRDFSEYITQAKTQELDPQEVADGLDAISLGYSNILKDVSPTDHIKLKGELSQITGGHFKGYINDLADIQITRDKATTAAEIESTLTKIPIHIDNILLTPGKTEQDYSDELVTRRTLTNNVLLNEALTKGKYNVSQIQKLRETLDKEHLNSYKAKIIAISLQTGTTSNNTAKMTANKKTGNSQIDAMLRQLNTEDRLKLIKEMRQAREDEISFQKAIDDSDDENSKTKFAESKLAAYEALDTNNIDEYSKQLIVMKTIDPDNKDIFDIERKRVELGGRRLTSNPVEFDRLQILANKNILDFDELNKFRGELSKKDYDSLFTEVEKDKDDKIKEALRKVVELREFDPLAERKEETKESRLYARLFGGLVDAQAEAQTELRSFNVKEWLAANVAEQNKEITALVRKEKLGQLETTFESIKTTIETVELNLEVSEFSLQNLEKLLTFINTSDDRKIKRLKKVLKNNGIDPIKQAKELKTFTDEFGNE
jgi:hypothetical protein